MDELLSGDSSTSSSLMTGSADGNPEQSLDYLDLGSVGELPDVVNDLDNFHEHSSHRLLMGSKKHPLEDVGYLKSGILATQPDPLYQHVDAAHFSAGSELSPTGLGAPLQYSDLVDSALFKGDSSYTFDQDDSLGKELSESTDTLGSSVILPNTGIDLLDLHMETGLQASLSTPSLSLPSSQSYLPATPGPHSSMELERKRSAQFPPYKFPPDSQFQSYGYNRPASNAPIAHPSSYYPRIRGGSRHIRATSMPHQMHHQTYPEGIESDPGHRRVRSVSKMPLSDLYVKMGLEHDPAEAKQREGRIMDAVKALGFDVGKKTWIRDTPDHERQKILDALTLQMAEYGYTRDLLDTIVRRGTYARMQSRLRQLRRHKRRESEANSSVSAF